MKTFYKYGNVVLFLTDYEEGGKHKWLTLTNGVKIEVFMLHGKPNPRMMKRFNKSWSFRQTKTTDI